MVGGWPLCTHGTVGATGSGTTSTVSHPSDASASATTGDVTPSIATARAVKGVTSVKNDMRLK